MANPPEGSHLLPGDDSWPADKVLIADLSTVNAQVSRYVMRYLDADAGRAHTVSIEDELALASRLTRLSELLYGRVERRVTLGRPPGTVAGDATPPPKLQPGPDLDR